MSSQDSLSAEQIVARTKVSAALYRLEHMRADKPLQVSVERDHIAALLREALAVMPDGERPAYIRTGVTA